MKQKTKDIIADVGTVVLTVGTACLVETLAGYGAVALLNHVIGDNWTKASVKFFQGVVFTGTVGIGALTATSTYDKFSTGMKGLMDLFPTDVEEVFEEVKQSDG